MEKSEIKKNYIKILLSTCLIVLFLLSASHARFVTQITPTLTITEEYSDNFLKTADNEQEEYITRYRLGFSAAFLGKKSKIYLGYHPEYSDYDNYDLRDAFEHNLSLSALLNPTKFTNLKASAAYTSNDEENTGETWENSASLSGDSQLTKNTSFSFSQSYKQSFEEEMRTGTYSEHEVNKSNVSINNKFGENDTIGFKFSYEFDDYKNSNADEYTLYKPSGNLTYWFNSLNGIDSSISYENKDLENSTDDLETYSGSIRYLRKISRHFDIYVKYNHTYTDRESGKHTIYHPSIGFDWEVTKDSGISLGAGVLFDEWEDSTNSDSEDLFFDINAYKVFNFNERSSLSLTGASGYSDSGEEASSLGYTIFYKGGLKLSYLLHKRLSSNLFASYKIDDFKDASTNRMDTDMKLGGSLSWIALQWLRFNLAYEYSEYDSDSAQRDGYSENKVIISASLIPKKPLRPDSHPSKDELDLEIFD